MCTLDGGRARVSEARALGPAGNPAPVGNPAAGGWRAGAGFHEPVACGQVCAARRGTGGGRASLRSTNLSALSDRFVRAPPAGGAPS